MAKKRKNKNIPTRSTAHHNPFKALKGFAVSAESDEKPQTQDPPPASETKAEVDFSVAMSEFGVQAIGHDDDLPAAENEETLASESPHDQIPVAKDDRELFLQAMDSLNVEFADELPDSQEAMVTPSSRMKRLRRGNIVPEATLDLHGALRHEVDDKMRHFLQRTAHQGAEVALVITGKGLHSAAGEPVVRRAVEEFLHREGKPAVVQWGRAPRRYGGEGALVMFLRRRKSNKLEPEPDA